MSIYHTNFKTTFFGDLQNKSRIRLDLGSVKWTQCVKTFPTDIKEPK